MFKLFSVWKQKFEVKKFIEEINAYELEGYPSDIFNRLTGEKEYWIERIRRDPKELTDAVLWKMNNIKWLRDRQRHEVTTDIVRLILSPMLFLPTEETIKHVNEGMQLIHHIKKLYEKSGPYVNVHKQAVYAFLMWGERSEKLLAKMLKNAEIVGTIERITPNDPRNFIRPLEEFPNITIAIKRLRSMNFQLRGNISTTEKWVIETVVNVWDHTSVHNFCNYKQAVQMIIILLRNNHPEISAVTTADYRIITDDFVY